MKEDIKHKIVDFCNKNNTYSYRSLPEELRELTTPIEFDYHFIKVYLILDRDNLEIRIREDIVTKNIRYVSNDYLENYSEWTRSPYILTIHGVIDKGFLIHIDDLNNDERCYL